MKLHPLKVPEALAREGEWDESPRLSVDERSSRKRSHWPAAYTLVCCSYMKSQGNNVTLIINISECEATLPSESCQVKQESSE